MAPFCQTCNRELGRKDEDEEVMKGLEEQTRAIPAKARRLEAKVARQRGRLEALHSIQMLKQLGWEVQEAEVKMKQLEKAVKGLQRELEVEELVLELREVGEEVQVVDSLEGDGAAGGEFADLGGEVREGGAAAGGWRQ